MGVPPKVITVILNWNGAKDTLECLASVSCLDYPGNEVIVVDNGSADDSVVAIRNAFPQATLIENGENLGFAEGNNVGIRCALDRGAEYVWLLNNDTVVDPKALSALVDLAEWDRDIGILGSKICYYDRPDVIWFAGARIDMKRAVSAHIGRLEKDVGQYEIVRPVDRVTGCSMMIRREVLEEVGLFDEKFFLYVEEVDLCVRARNHGYGIYYVPDSRVYHKVSISSGESSGPVFDYYNTRNFLYLIWKNLEFPKREVFLARNIARTVYRRKGTILRWIAPGLFLKKEGMLQDIAPLKGILHFLAGKMGKGDFDYFMAGKRIAKN